MSNIDLIKGDCLEVMDELIARGVKVKCFIVDLPYGTTAHKDDVIIPFAPMWERVLKLRYDERTPIIMFADGLFDAKLKLSNEKMWRYDRTWNKILKSGHLNANKMPLRQTETINVFYEKLPYYNPQKVQGKKPNSRGKNLVKNNSNYGKHKGSDIYEELNHPTSLITVQKPTPAKSIHRTEKPVELLRELVSTFTKVGDLVMDFTCGAGATIVACKELGRDAIGIDNGISDKKGEFYGWHWIDVTQKRIEDTDKGLFDDRN